MTGPILLTAWLGSPLAGEPPQLDALLEWSLGPFEPGFRQRQTAGLLHPRIDRKFPAPPAGVIPIPIRRTHLGSWPVAHCSSPILSTVMSESVEHFTRRLSVEHAEMLASQERRTISTSGSWTKSWRLPLRIRLAVCVRWFCFGNERNLHKALKDVHAIGKKTSIGYGRVRQWTTEPAAEDWSWFARHKSGTVLMRPLPARINERSWLPNDLIGFQQHWGACVPPYWHPDRFTEIVIPSC